MTNTEKREKVYGSVFLPASEVTRTFAKTEIKTNL